MKTPGFGLNKLHPGQYASTWSPGLTDSMDLRRRVFVFVFLYPHCESNQNLTVLLTSIEFVAKQFQPIENPAGKHLSLEGL